MRPVVYQATNKVTGHRYIGVTVNLIKRRSGHYRDAERGKANYPFHRAIRKYGREGFEWKILEEFDDVDEALAAERRLIRQHKPEYNLTLGGDYKRFTFEERSAFHQKRSAASYLTGLDKSAVLELRRPLPDVPTPTYIENDEECWRPVIGYEGFYEISDHGNIRSCDRETSHYASKSGMMRRKGRTKKPRPMADGRLFITLHREDRKPWVASLGILVAEAFIAPRSLRQNVLRRDGNPLNDRASNLYWGDEKARAENRERLGRSRRGRLSDGAVFEIRALRGKVKLKEAAKRYGVCETLISNIQLGKAYRHVAP